jgi:hypothetical protein
MSSDISTGESYDVLLGKVRGIETSGGSGFDVYRYEIVGCAVLFVVTASLLYIIKPQFICKKTLSHHVDATPCRVKILSYAFLITLIGAVFIVSYSKYTK